MSKFSDNSETMNTWLGILKPITIEDFCQRWVPRFFDVQTENKTEYRKACVTLLINLTNKQNKTVQNWITYPENVPNDVKQYLGVVDLLWNFKWEARILFPEIEKLKQIYSVLQVQPKSFLKDKEEKDN